MSFAKETVFSSIFPSAYFIGDAVGIAPSDVRASLIQQGLSKNPKAEESQLRFYGYANPSFNKSQAQNSNTPVGFQIVPNALELSELTFTLDKPLQFNHQHDAEIGFKLTSLYGIDARFTTMDGVFSNQLYQKNALYPFDLPEANLQFYLPEIGNGSILTLGRFSSPADIELPLAPSNYLVSHSLTFNYNMFTLFGATLNTQLNEEWSSLIGMHSGSDIAPWSTQAIPTFIGYVQWTDKAKKDSVWFGISALNNGQYREYHDNLQETSIIWTHRFSDKFFVMTESYYEYQFNARAGGSCIFGPAETYALGGCGPVIPGYSSSIALVNFIEYQNSERQYWSLRSDYFNDFQGQRSGFATSYFGWTLGTTFLLTPQIKIRPEFRYNLATSLLPFDDGSKGQIFLGLIDFLVML
jgi:Putative beta-barrel porin-2, OmpL-like. bbp2